MQKLLTFFSKNSSLFAIFNDQSFNHMLTNDIVSAEQLGPGIKRGIEKILIRLGGLAGWSEALLSIQPLRLFSA